MAKKSKEEEAESKETAHARDQGEPGTSAGPSAAKEKKPAAAPAAVPVAGVFVAPMPVPPIPGVVLIGAVPNHEHVWGPPVPDPIAWLFCILFFPFGIIALCLCTHRYCQICGAVLYDW